jgi:hypothetical protein
MCTYSEVISTVTEYVKIMDLEFKLYILKQSDIKERKFI